MIENNLAIIPARGGSKGIPNKNIHPLNGKPLICYSIETALQSKTIKTIIVSTDSTKIADIVRQYKGVDLIMRPPDLSQDNTPTLPVLLHVLENLPYKELPIKIITLQPTSPLRKAEQIDEAVGLLTPDVDACVSVCLSDHSPYKMFKIKNGILSKLFDNMDYGIPRQLLPEVFRENGAIYVTWTNILLNKQTIWGDKTIPYIMDASTSIDIDNVLDVRMAELYLQEKQTL